MSEIQEIFKSVEQSGYAENYDSYYDFLYTNNPNKVIYYKAVQFVKFGILCNASHNELAFVEGDLFDTYEEAVSSILEYFDNVEEAIDNDTKIVLVHGEEVHREDGDKEINIIEWKEI